MQFNKDERVRRQMMRCARLEGWLQLENDPTERDKIAEALEDAREQLAEEVKRVEREAGGEPKANDNADTMFPQGNVTDFLKKLDEAGAEKKEAEATPEAEQKAEAEQPAQELEADDAREQAPERARELMRELEPPPEIEELPEYKELYDEALARYTAEGEAHVADTIEAGNSAERVADQAPANDYADVPELEADSEMEGTVEAVVEREERTYYIVKDEEDHMAAVPVDRDTVELEAGDDVHVSRDQDGSYDVSTGDDYGL